MLPRCDSLPPLAYTPHRMEWREDPDDALAAMMRMEWQPSVDTSAKAGPRLWLIAVVRAVARNLDPRRARWILEGGHPTSELFGAYRDDAERCAEREAIRAAVQRLEDDEREVLLLTAWEGLKPSEIALVLDISPAVARTRLRRALAHLASEPSANERNSRSARVGAGGSALGYLTRRGSMSQEQLIQRVADSACVTDDQVAALNLEQAEAELLSVIIEEQAAVRRIRPS